MSIKVTCDRCGKEIAHHFEEPLIVNPNDSVSITSTGLLVGHSTETWIMCECCKNELYKFMESGKDDCHDLTEVEHE